jgi:hypothetical protein
MGSVETMLVCDGGATLYRVFDVGYEIDLPRAADLLAPASAARPRPRRGEAVAIVTPRPPVTVALDAVPREADGIPVSGASAALFDFGVVSIRLHATAGVDASWEGFASFAAALHGSARLRAMVDEQLSALLARIAPAVRRPNLVPLTEDYVVFRARGLRTAQGEPGNPAQIPDDALARLLLNEPRPLASSAKQDLLPHRFSYTTADFVALTWESALVIEPDETDRDVEYVLEFANAQLLELRVFDAALDGELPRLYDRIAAVRGASYMLLRRRYRALLADLQTLVADVTEIVERVENAFKVTDDVYLARIYLAALELFRGGAWRRGIDRKLAILRDTYGMLNAESQAARGEALEVAIVLLIVSELLLSLFGRG